MNSRIYGRYPSVPEYYQQFIDKDVDLSAEPKQCCPFHKEDTPSFSYDLRTGRWSCFGACHAHGDVIEMHKRWFKFQSKELAEMDLAKRFGVDITKVEYEKQNKVFVNPNVVSERATFMKAQLLANTPERQAELDYVMSIVPLDENMLFNLYCEWVNEKK